MRVGDELWFYYSGRTFRHGGYSGNDRGTEEAGEPVIGDGTDLAVRWPDGAPNPLLTSDPVQLRFNIRNARLYAYWMW